MAEFKDLALMNVMAAEGRGFIARPSLVAAEAVSRYQFVVIGAAEKCRVQFHAITAELPITHPGVAVITGKR